jgi:intracellular sulfur oxidation DsrE/DsrF family protein
LLTRPVAPHGVVFEIVDRDPSALEVALPWVKQAAQRLKARYPALPMALVTHGQEMFALQNGKRDSNPAVHQMAESLSRDDGIPVHVCGTYAGWRGLAPEDFPAYVDVAPAGPTQIRNYEALDYVRLVVPGAAELKTR